ncbi:hypothetical protein COCON_G00166650 [Conger conger]|uniref:Uncharacterized protein n=1 Tax=Conger conger TaxID=82655 RepID=A0A9Q1HS36_CONCO|nr:hypothetical protein COCON_G00166650 [Conger conger]
MLIPSWKGKFYGRAVLGPIVVQEADTDVMLESHGSLKTDHQAGGGSGAVAMAGVVAVLGLVCLIVLEWRHYKPIAL